MNSNSLIALFYKKQILSFQDLKNKFWPRFDLGWWRKFSDTVSYKIDLTAFGPMHRLLCPQRPPARVIVHEIKKIKIGFFCILEIFIWNFWTYGNFYPGKMVFLTNYCMDHTVWKFELFIFFCQNNNFLCLLRKVLIDLRSLEKLWIRSRLRDFGHFLACHFSPVMQCAG